MIEADVKRAILAAIGALPGVFVWVNNTGMLYDRTGRPVRFGILGGADLICCTYGRFVALEVKRSYGGVVSDRQRRFAAAVEAAGGIYAVVRSPSEALEVLALAKEEHGGVVRGCEKPTRSNRRCRASSEREAERS